MIHPCACANPDYCNESHLCLRQVRDNLVPVVGLTASYTKPFKDLTDRELSLVPKTYLDAAVKRARG